MVLFFRTVAGAIGYYGQFSGIGNVGVGKITLKIILLSYIHICINRDFLCQLQVKRFRLMAMVVLVVATVVVVATVAAEAVATAVVAAAVVLDANLHTARICSDFY